MHVSHAHLLMLTGCQHLPPSVPIKMRGYLGLWLKTDQITGSVLCIVQASTDGVVWVDLRQHTDDCTINMAGQYASWPVTGHAARRPFRFFQLLLAPAASTSGRANSRTSPLSYLEFYGYFFREASSS
jgi:hypothetical protein